VNDAEFSLFDQARAVSDTSVKIDAKQLRLLFALVPESVGRCCPRPVGTADRVSHHRETATPSAGVRWFQATGLIWHEACPVVEDGSRRVHQQDTPRVFDVTAIELLPTAGNSNVASEQTLACLANITQITKERHSEGKN